jgi:putative transposase
MLKVRDAGSVSSRAVYLAIGVNLDGMKEVLGMWTAQTEGAKFWLAVITELKNRGVADILIACVDGLKGFPEATGWPWAIEAVFPHTEVQLCLVHLVRHSLKYVTWKEREAVAKDLKTIYSATTVDEDEVRLNEFADTWDEKYPSIAKSWRANWVRIIPLFAYSADIRKAIYTTNAIESVNFSLRKLTKIRGSFPNDEAAIKLLYLGLRNITKRWTMPIPNWKKALNQLMIKFEDRLTTA